jgi:hypothetical protein
MLVKITVELIFVLIVAYPLSVLIEIAIPIENLLEVAAGTPPETSSLGIAGGIAVIFVFCRWDQPKANKPSALTERFGLWVSQMTDEEE